jgi:WD40 repeat protein
MSRRADGNNHTYNGVSPAVIPSFFLSHVPGMLATCSVDKSVTLWDTYNADNKLANEPPMAKMNKDMRVGKLYTVNFYPSSPWLLGCAGGAKEMALWDMTRDDNVQRCFGSRAVPAAKTPATSEQQPTNEKEAAFDAMMTATPAVETGKEPERPSTKSKKKGNKKKKVHKAGR